MKAIIPGVSSLPLPAAAVANTCTGWWFKTTASNRRSVIRVVVLDRFGGGGSDGAEDRVWRRESILSFRIGFAPFPFASYQMKSTQKSKPCWFANKQNSNAGGRHGFNLYLELCEDEAG